METLCLLNIENNSYIIGYEIDTLMLYDEEDKFKNSKSIATWGFFKVFEKQNQLKKNDVFYIWIPIKKYYTIKYKETKNILDWLESHNCKEIYKIDGYYGSLAKYKALTD